MKMIVGLGNPGSKYAHTKHNVGFDTLDQLAQALQVSVSKNEFSALTGTLKVGSEKIMLVKPLTYMNDSGRAVGQLAQYYQFYPEEIAVIQDDLDLALAKLRLRTHGASGGHNGIKSIISALGTDHFNRVKIGIQHPQRQKVVDWVLSPFTGDERIAIEQTMDRATTALSKWSVDDVDFAALMNEFN
ncbi:aminoacyl-tRNA hydrolase [Lapidilactobacillus achengensis]|uniref:Peptidyl-tRNA hydrolase n=1 Tax=Lapidilactobacillus achengensis TaxID=2486000 RepID=A0ABW1USD4_9LACO|nr:aminoacyl-tRNA hydrolase [Lapidilactobacillus achengensis]